MIELLTGNAAVGVNAKRYIHIRILKYGYCTVDDVAQLNGVLAVQISVVGWPLTRVGWIEMPEITYRKESMENFWRIQIDDPVRLSLDSLNSFKNEGIESLVDTYPYGWTKHRENIFGLNTCDGFRGGKIYDVKTIHKEDIKDAMNFATYFTSIINQIEEGAGRKRLETTFTPKSIEQSADHKTVCVLWQDGTRTIVKLSDNDKDDIDTAFAYALAKKIFGTNTHLKKVVQEHLNEHKPKIKELPSDPNQEELPSDPDPKEITENG